MKSPRATEIFLNDIWDSSTTGFYVEIGAFDGVRKNSTIIMERAGWDGVCVEPTPSSFRNLQLNRLCRCLNVAVYDQRGELEFAMFPSRPEWNGIIQTFDHHHHQHLDHQGDEYKKRAWEQPQIIKVQCVTWADLRLPQHIDYLQLDAEGAELKILNCIDWNHADITFICLEDVPATEGDNTLVEFMESKNYELVFKLKFDHIWKKKQ